MLKFQLIMLLLFLGVKIASAQKKIDTVVYYLKNDGKVVSTKDSAEILLKILSPDINSGGKFYRVSEYYANGKTRMIALADTNTLNLKFQGSKTIFFPNGNKMNTMNYDNGEPIGDVLEFYPNGKTYNRKSFVKNAAGEKELLYQDCNDSTGVVLAKNGVGKWLDFNDDFIDAISGQIANGYQTGEWKSKINDTTDFVTSFVNGKPINSNYYYKSGNKVYVPLEVPPEFMGGLKAYGVFLAKNIRYPIDALRAGTQGRVIVSFVVERDGTLSNLKVERGLGDSLDKEALRVMSLSPKWIPGMQNGKAVRVAYTVPIAFTLHE